MKIILFGGTFDPVHKGHIETVKYVRDYLKADHITFIPTGVPPHKKSNITESHHRINMIHCSAFDAGLYVLQYSVSEFEARKKDVSYTIDTINYMYEWKKDVEEFFFLVGADQAKVFKKWKKSDEITKLVNMVAVVRPPYSNYDLEDWEHAIINVPQIDISSTKIRECLRNKDFDNPIVNKGLYPNVVKYIKENSLYV